MNVNFAKRRIIKREGVRERVETLFFIFTCLSNNNHFEVLKCIIIK